jgi:AcrR family transcriptional regulator
MIIDKKEAILDAMLDMVIKTGFHSSPMSKLAKEANVAAGTIYHYFTSKDEIIDAIYQRYKERLGKIALIPDDTSKPYKERFKAFYLGTLYYLLNNPKEFVFAEQYQKSPFYSRLSRDKIMEFENPVLEFLRKGIHTQNLKDIPPKLMMNLIMSSIASLAQINATQEMRIDYTLNEILFNICWDGLKRS